MRLLISFLISMMLFQHPALAQSFVDTQSDQPEIVKPDSIDPDIKPDDDAPADSAAIQDMTLERFTKIIASIDSEAVIQGSSMQLTVADVTVIVITDVKNNRMRAFVPIQSLDGINQQLLYRMLQANFDSALDARYAIAREHVISVFIHPLKELRKDQLIEGIGQVVNLVKTYGSAFTSGAMTFGGGDSRNLHRKLIDELLKKGEEI